MAFSQFYEIYRFLRRIVCEIRCLGVINNANTIGTLTMNTISSFLRLVLTPIAFIGVTPLVPLIILMWCLTLMSQQNESTAISDVL